MQSQERDLIEGLFNRLKAYEAQPRDPEAERLIAGLITSQPGAAYLLTQTVLVQEQALKAAQQRIAELEAKAVAAPPAGFLESAPKIGPWGAAPAAAAAPATRSPLQAAVAPPAASAAPAAGGSFLRSALATAAGVAGGALLFDGIRSLLGRAGSPFATQGYLDPVSTATLAPQPDTPLMPPDQMPDQFSSVDLAQDDGAADDYDMASDDSGTDSGFDDSDIV
ncbi:MAG: DUF2076 domain-containing protein [Proteobacteria bacterium]|nr:DUF2076 domain-containing protein [Pseudomonadota bacterium]